MRKKRTYKRKRGPVVSKKIEYDGIKFASGLEKYMYCALKKAGIKAKYEGETFVLINGFHFENKVYERQSNSKGLFKNRGCKRILPIKYTPDFIGENFIIETKSLQCLNDSARTQLSRYLLSSQLNTDSELRKTKYGVLINWPGATVDTDTQMLTNKNPEVEFYVLKN